MYKHGFRKHRPTKSAVLYFVAQGQPVATATPYEATYDVLYFVYNVYEFLEETIYAVGIFFFSSKLLIQVSQHSIVKKKLLE